MRCALPMRYRVTPRHAPAVTGTGMTCDISEAGVGFLCGEALPEGAHIEVVAEWPARPAGQPPMNLRMTGFVLRSNQAAAAVAVTSHKLCAGKRRQPGHARRSLSRAHGGNSVRHHARATVPLFRCSRRLAGPFGTRLVPKSGSGLYWDRASVR